MNFNLRFETEKQFIEGVAASLIKNHLEWSGSDKGTPSESDGGRVSGEAREAFMSAKFEGRTMREVGDEEAERAQQELQCLYEEAKRIADAKWQAALTLLGIEAM